MRNIPILQDWTFGHGQYNSMMAKIHGDVAHVVQLPHDYMIESDVQPQAPAGPASGFYTEGVAYYLKTLDIPSEWEGEQIGLYCDGAMMNAVVYVNGDRAALQHYGYAPFYTDITRLVYPGRSNQLMVQVNPSMQPNSRWYSGAGLFRGMTLVHKPKLAIKEDGIFGTTERLEWDEHGHALRAFVKVRVEIENHTTENRMTLVTVSLYPEGLTQQAVTRSLKLMVPAKGAETAILNMTVEHPNLWSAETPDLYTIQALAKDLGIYKTHEMDHEDGSVDVLEARFGIRTVTADAVHGLQVNGQTVKLAGGCLHHDNGMLGAVSLYDAEVRKLTRMKEIGFNAVRTTHNPPSSAFLEACDRLGLYVIDEAFDAWGIEKQPGDYSMFFDTDWEKDLTAFIRRDRNCPSVIMWSTGNEIPERGGLGQGFTLAAKLAAKVHALDMSRPVTNAICSMWSGLDTFLTEEQQKKFLDASAQNADPGKEDHSWEDYTEAFTNGLDVVGYNYLEDRYAYDMQKYPDRVILGSENFGNEIGMHWPMILKTPCVIGDFTWTAYDYLGEAGIGRSIFVDADDPRIKMGPWALSSHASAYPWRLANDADIDINGGLLPQGAYRSVVFGSTQTHLYTYDPDVYEKTELISRWGFTDARKSWTWDGQEGKPTRALIFSKAEEVELCLNGVSIGRYKAGERAKEGLPGSFLFDLSYEPGTLVAISYTDGQEVSRDVLQTAGTIAKLVLKTDRTAMPADGVSVAYVDVEIVDEQGVLVPNAAIPLKAKLDGEGAYLAAFGSANPETEENYTKSSFTSFRGKATAILRSIRGKGGKVTLSIAGQGLLAQESIQVVSE